MGWSRRLWGTGEIENWGSIGLQPWLPGGIPWEDKGNIGATEEHVRVAGTLGKPQAPRVI